MNIRRITSLTLLIIVLFSGNVITLAQEDDSALLQMLALVLDESHNDLHFNDFAAIEQAYPPAQQFRDWVEFETLTPNTAEALFPQDVWWSVLQMASPGLHVRSTLFEEIPGAMGIDYFQIDRMLIHLSPPRDVYYLNGVFNIEDVREALTARGFSQQPSDLELWCGEDGCENGSRTNRSNSSEADLLGGRLRRNWARLIAPEYLIGANNFADLQAVEQTITEDRDSLADNPRYRAAAEALSGQGVLLQATIMPESGLAFFADPVTLIGLPALYNQPEDAFETVLEQGFETLPPFKLLMLADVVSDTEQMGQIILVYTDETDAEQAARILPARIEAYHSLYDNLSFVEQLEERRVEQVTAEVVPSDDWFAVLVTFATPKATPEEIVQFVPTSSEERPDVTSPGAVYGFLLQNYIVRDLGWLSTVTLEQLEELAGN